MARKSYNPLRSTRMEYGRSTKMDMPDGSTAYKVDLREKEGAEKISGIEKFVQRDFKIGASVAYLATGIIGGLLGAPLAGPLVGAAAVSGAMIGGISDYMRNNKEMEEGAVIKEPTRFNRDTVKSALGWSVFGKLTVGLGIMGLGAAGVTVGAPLVAALTVAASASGLLFGAVRGSENGYNRMAAEYQAAERKNLHPELSVSVARNQEPVIDRVVDTSPFVAAGVDMLAQSGNAQMDEAAWHPAQNAQGSFVDREMARRNQALVGQVDR